MSWEREYGPGWRIWEQAYAMAERKVDKQRICDLLRANKELVNGCFKQIIYDISKDFRERREPIGKPMEYLLDVYSRYNWLY